MPASTSCPPVFLLTTLILATLVLPVPVRSNDLPADDSELLELYFAEEELVETATRTPKPISQIAENVTIITAEEIEAMNAHTVAEVLDRVAGVFVSFTSRESIPASSVSIHGSLYEQVAVYIDGIRWRWAADLAETCQIPVQIIKRIEVIKGPASSTWGSSLGGVVNIITRDAGKSDRPFGTISAAYGEGATHDLRADISGRASRVGYYLYVGSRESDGIDEGRYFRNKSVYGKTEIDLPWSSSLTLTLGHTGPENKYYVDRYNWGDEGFVDERDFFATINFDTRLSDTLALNLSLRRFDNDFNNTADLLSTGETYWDYSYNTENTGASTRLVYTPGGHTVVIGADYDRIEENDIDAITPYVADTIYDEFWGVYINDTVRWRDFTFTPGLRYDYLTLSDDQVSPSLGVTYQFTGNTLLRAVAARGFRKPIAGVTRGDVAIWYTTNPDLEPEKVDSLQAGVETTACPHVRLKTTLFLHKADKTWEYAYDSTQGWQLVNGGKAERTGAEIEMETVPWHHLSLVAGAAYVHTDPEAADEESDSMHQVNLGLRYHDKQGWYGELFGHFVNYPDSATYDTTQDDDFLWELNLRKTVVSREPCSVDIFATVHNLFNSSQYERALHANASRWAEVGIRVRY